MLEPIAIESVERFLGAFPIQLVNGHAAFIQRDVMAWDQAIVHVGRNQIKQWALAAWTLSAGVVVIGAYW